MKHTMNVLFTVGILFSQHICAQWVNGQNASIVLGQSNFTSNSFGTSNITFKFNSSDGAITVDKSTNKMYVADSDNNRVLRYTYPSGGITSNQPTAEVVFGQADFSGSAAGQTASTFSQPADVFAKNDTLWVADYSNNRVLGFLNASTKSSGAAADIVIGQSSFTANTRTSAPNSMGEPAGLAVDDYGSLYVAQYSFGRVMKFPKAALTTGGSATAVFGSSALSAAGGGAVSVKTFFPWKIAIKNNSLFIVDYDYIRVLRFDNINSVTTDPSAAVVFGASTFGIAGSATATQSTFVQPSGIAIDDANRLYVSDYSGNRVLVFANAFTSTNGVNASFVLGQSNYTNSSSAITQDGLSSPDGLFLDSPNKQLYVCDLGNHRIMQYTASSALPVELTSFTVQRRNGSSLLSWTTATETDNYRFEIERMNSSGTLPLDRWINIGFVEGAGTSSSVHHYSFSDHEALVTAHYRLKQIDRNGKVHYSNELVVSTEIPKKISLEQNYPNPFNPATEIRYELPSNGYTTLNVYNILGKHIITLTQGEESAGAHTVTFNGGEQSSGLYYYTLRSVNTTVTRTMVLTK